MENRFDIEGSVLKKFHGMGNVIVPEGVKIIGDSAFMFRIRVNEIVLPEGVTRIEEYSFYKCKDLNIITLPASLVYIGKSAFKGCANLLEINFGGTKKQWQEIKKEQTFYEDENADPSYVMCDWDYYFGDYVVHCTDGYILNN